MNTDACNRAPNDRKARPYVGVAVIVLREGQVLLGKRKNAHGAGTWQFPGGHLEYGESIEACARRELREETGLLIDKLRRGPFTNDFFAEERKHYVTLFVIAEQTRGDPQLREPDRCECWDWFPWNRLPEPCFLPIVNLRKQNFAIDPQQSAGKAIKERLAAMADPERARTQQRFFKTGPGEYGHGDIFIGVKVPQLRKLAKQYADADMMVIEELLHSPVHEHRHLALFLLIQQFEQADAEGRAAIVNLYLANTACINNWDLVDCSAHCILGAFLHDRESQLLHRLAQSENLWERRMAIVATWHFIRNGQLDETFALAARLLTDTQDLIHKAVGWMLREAGKRDEDALVTFIKTHYQAMPRTMLRYAIERFDGPRRKQLLKGQW